MSRDELITQSDFILSFGTMLDENQDVKKSVLEAILNNSSNFVYMHPIDNNSLKNSYSQFIKYEVGSEEGICALLLEAFVKNSDEDTRKFIDDLD